MIVMKFGGTSVEDATAIDRVASIVQGPRLRESPFVVVSAMAKVTDQLLPMARRSRTQASATGPRTLPAALRERHYNTAGELLGTGVFTPSFTASWRAEFDALDELLRGIAAVGELTPRTTDHVAAYGERLSSRIVTAAFRARGIPAALVDAAAVIITDAHPHARRAPDRRNQ